MKNSDINYKTSKDYGELHRLLKSGVVLIGFIAIDIDGVTNMEYSKLIPMMYSSRFKSFDIGMALFEPMFSKERFIKVCKDNNIQYLIP